MIAGVDEAGRGPLAGPVYAAVVVLDPQRPIAGLDDSKKLSPKRREILALAIRERALGFAIASASAAEINALNILQATFLAMQRAVHGLCITPAEVWVDGNRAPRWDLPTRCVVGGDATVDAISAASILAKTARDGHMADLARQYPEYGFDRHAGYPTPAHLAALQRHGPCPEHRRSFAPVARHLAHESCGDCPAG